MSSIEIKLLIVLSVFVPINGENPKHHWTLAPNVLVLDVDGQQGQYPLRCLESMERGGVLDQHILWEIDGKDTDKRGNTFLVHLEESFGGGNYTCYSEDGLLNHTLVLLHRKDATNKLIPIDQGGLKCTAPNYNGSFHCSWSYKYTRVRTVVFVKAERVGDTRCFAAAQSWTCSSGKGAIHCDLDSSGTGISCRETCPPLEETQLLEVSVYVRTQHYLLESYSRALYLKDIVKPDTVNIKWLNKTTVEWSYPDTWSKPYSFFPLISEVAISTSRERGNPCAKLSRNQIVKSHPPGMFQFAVDQRATVCVRVRDPLCPSKWSDWIQKRMKRREKQA